MDLIPSQYQMTSEAECKSGAQFRFGQRLKQVFPYSTILEEFGIPKSGALAIDFWLPNEKFAFEVHGGQHFKFVKHFHGNQQGFRRQKMNDAKKKRWCEMNGITLISVRDTEVDSVDIVGLLNGEAD
jgi:hypothetical protein